jgi:hypothetical protein
MTTDPAAEDFGPLERKHLQYANFRAVAGRTEVTKTHWHIALANGLGWAFHGMDSMVFSLVSPLVITEFALDLPSYRSGVQIAWISWFLGTEHDLDCRGVPDPHPRCRQGRSVGDRLFCRLRTVAARHGRTAAVHGIFRTGIPVHSGHDDRDGGRRLAVGTRTRRPGTQYHHHVRRRETSSQRGSGPFGNRFIQCRAMSTRGAIHASPLSAICRNIRSSAPIRPGRPIMRR